MQLVLGNGMKESMSKPQKSCGQISKPYFSQTPYHKGELGAIIPFITDFHENHTEKLDELMEKHRKKGMDVYFFDRGQSMDFDLNRIGSKCPQGKNYVLFYNTLKEDLPCQIENYLIARMDDDELIMVPDVESIDSILKNHNPKISKNERFKRDVEYKSINNFEHLFGDFINKVKLESRVRAYLPEERQKVEEKYMWMCEELNRERDARRSKPTKKGGRTTLPAELQVRGPGGPVSMQLRK